MFHVILKGDAWIMFFLPESQYDVLVQVGRYLARVTSILINDNELANSFVYIFWFISIYMLIYLPLCKTRYPSPNAAILGASLFLFSPPMIELSVFQLAIPERSLGILAVSYAVFLFSDTESGSSTKYWLSAIPLGIAAACYQPMALMYPVGIYFTLLANSKLNTKTILEGIFSCLLGLLFYIILWRFFIFLFDLDMSGVPDRYNPLLLNDLPIPVRIDRFKNLLWGFFFGPKGDMPVASSVIMLLIYSWGVIAATKQYFFGARIAMLIVSTILFIGIFPNLIFLLKGSGSAIRPQALLGMFLFPSLMISCHLSNVFKLNEGELNQKSKLSFSKSIYIFLSALLIAIQAFQVNASVTNRYLAFEKDKNTASFILSDIMEAAPRKDEITVFILSEVGRGPRYQPEVRYYSLPWTMTGIGNNNVFDNRLDSFSYLLDFVSPPQINIAAYHLNTDDSKLSDWNITNIDSVRPWPNPESIRTSETGEVLIKLGDPKDPKYSSDVT